MHLVYVIPNAQAEELANIKQRGYIQRQSVVRNWKTTTDPAYYQEWVKGDPIDVTLVQGVYLKLWPSLQLKQSTEIVLDLDWSLLDRVDWHFNTTENHGFFLYGGYSIFSGDEGVTYSTLEHIVRHYSVIQEQPINFGEMVLPNADVPMEFIRNVFIDGSH